MMSHNNQTYHALKEAIRRGNPTWKIIHAGEELLADFENKELRLDLVKCYMLKNNKTKALGHLYSIAKLDENRDPYIWAEIGNIEMKCRHFSEAERAFSHELEHAQDDRKYLAKVSLAKVAAAKNNYDKALRIMDEVLEDPHAKKDRLVYTLKASFLRSSGHADQAQFYLDEAAAIPRRGSDHLLKRDMAHAERLSQENREKDSPGR